MEARLSEDFENSLTKRSVESVDNPFGLRCVAIVLVVLLTIIFCFHVYRYHRRNKKESEENWRAKEWERLLEEGEFR